MHKSCPMASGKGYSRRAIACTCAVSQGESPLIPDTHGDFRFDLPGRALPHLLSFSRQAFIQDAFPSLSGYAHPPEQPPESLL